MSNPKPTEHPTPASSEILLTLLETLPDALFLIDDAATVVYANACAQAIAGATREDVCGKPLWRSAPQLVSTALYQAVQKTRQTRIPGEVEYRSPVTQTWLRVQLSPTVGGLLLLFHQGRTAAHRQQVVPQCEYHSIKGLDDLYSRIAVLTPEGIVLEINEVSLKDEHIRQEEVIGQPLAQTRWWSCSSLNQEQLRASIKRASRGETVRFETMVHPREGQDLSLDVVLTPHKDAEHHISYLVLAGIDITTRKRTEAELHALIDTIPQLVWTVRPDGSRDSCNQRWCDYTGQSSKEAQGEGWMQCLHPEDWPHVRSVWQRAVQAGAGYEVELRLRHGATGEYRWFLARAIPVRDETGQIVKWFGSSTDIEEQKRTEQQLKENEANWQVLAETVPLLVWIARPDGHIEYVNQRCSDYNHSTREQLQDDGWNQFLHPDDAERAMAVREHAFRTGVPFESEHRLRDSQTETYRWFLVRAMPVRDEAGQIIKWFGTGTDIDKQKQTEQQLKESREHFRMLAEIVPQLVWTTQPDGCADYFNQRYHEYTYATFEQLQGYGWRQFLHPEDAERVVATRQQSLQTGEPFEVEYRLRNGQTGVYRWFLTRAMPMRDETGQIIKWFGTSTDIDEQKHIEEALRESQERVSVLMNSSIIGINIAEGEQIVDANDTFLRMTGYTQEDLRAGKINWMHMTPPEYLACTQQAHQELATRQSMMPYEKEYVCKDGSRLPALVGRVVLEQHPHQAIGFVLDNSARKELEQRKDAFISMASHELRNPLTALKMQTSLLRRQLTRQGIEAPALSSMEAQLNKVIRLVEELLDVSKIQAGRLEYRQETVDLDALLREIIDTMQHTNPSHTILMRGTVQCCLMGDRDRLGQVFTNLLSNAIKYSPDIKTVEVDLNTSEEVVTISVQDHGLGIPREQRDKVFERFYRASGPRQRAIPGLGMGLYIVAEIVKGHGGTITVESDVGKGSIFTVTLPKKREA